MPICYRGAGPGTYWDINDATVKGLTARAPHVNPSIDRLMDHIVNATVNSPYISLTRSYGVAEVYAKVGTLGVVTKTNPGYVYEIVLNDPLPGGLDLLDPVTEVASVLPSPLTLLSYQRNGPPNVLLGVVDPQTNKQLLYTPVPQPPGSGVGSPPNITIQLKALVRALRDAEILAVGNIPKSCVQVRYPA